MRLNGKKLTLLSLVVLNVFGIILSIFVIFYQDNRINTSKFSYIEFIDIEKLNEQLGVADEIPISLLHKAIEERNSISKVANLLDEVHLVIFQTYHELILATILILILNIVLVFIANFVFR